MNYILDTNIILHYIRQDYLSKYIDDLYAPLQAGQITILSVVSIGEIKSIARQAAWGIPKYGLLDKILLQLLRADITSAIIDRYAEIDAYSQNKILENPLGASARNMGKNDLWIAATASVLGARLLTTDKDFDHLSQQYIDLLYIDPTNVVIDNVGV